MVGYESEGIAQKGRVGIVGLRFANPTYRTAFDLIEKNDKLNGTDAYWRLNDLRFE